MTLALGIVARDGILLASDRRRSMPAQNAARHVVLSETAEKLVNLENGLWLARATTQAAALETVIDAIRERLGDEPGMTVRMTRAAQIAREQWSASFGLDGDGVPARAWGRIPEASFMMAGFDRRTDATEPRIYTMRSSLRFAPEKVSSGFSIVGVADHCIAAKLAHRPEETTVDEAKHLALHLIATTADNKWCVGRSVRVVCLLPSGEEITTVECV